MEINKLDIFLTRETQKFCLCDLSLSNCHAWNNRLPESPVTENKACNNWCMGAYERDIACHSWPGLSKE